MVLTLVMMNHYHLHLWKGKIRQHHFNLKLLQLYKYKTLHFTGLVSLFLYSLPPETEENFTRMTMTEKLMTVFLGIILPAVDVFTDILFVIKMFKNKHNFYGLCALSPIMISNIWSFFHWRRVEKSTKGKSKVMAILAFIFQLWPQYRAMRLLYFDRKLTLDLSPVSRKNYIQKFQEEKDIYSKDLCFLGR